MTTLANYRLPDRLRATLAMLTRVIVTDEVEELGITEEVVDSVEMFLRTIPTPVRIGFAAGLHTFEQSARAVPSSFGRSFSSLPVAKAEAHFERWWSSPVGPLHQLARGARMFVTFAYYEHPKVRERLGYDPDAWIAKVKAERLAEHAEEIAAHEEALLKPDPLPPTRAPRRLPEADHVNA